MIFLLSSAFASSTPVDRSKTDPPASLPKADSLEVIRRQRPKPPSEINGVFTCNANVVIGEDGKPQEVVVSPEAECPEPYATLSKEAFEQWRWKRPMVNGVPSRVGTQLKSEFRGNGATPTGPGILPAGRLSVQDRERVAAFHHPGPTARPPSEPCRLEVVAHADGSVSSVQTNDMESCLVVPSGGADVRKAVWKSLDEPTSCTIGFWPVGTRNTKVRAAKTCPKKLASAAGLLLDEWRVNALPDLPYEMTIVFTP